MSVADDLARAIHYEIDMLLTIEGEVRLVPKSAIPPTPIYPTVETVYARNVVVKDSDIARRLLRVEIERDTLMRDLATFTAHIHNLYDDEPGPQQFMGVDIYQVDNLPAPHWRIVNPMRKGA